MLSGVSRDDNRPRPDLNVIVCVDPRKCLFARSQAGSGAELYQDLQSAVREQGFQDAVQVTPCRCIFGCTYGPRIDVAKRWSGEKVLYGTIDGEATITRRGTVRFREIPYEISRVILDNLPNR